MWTSKYVWSENGIFILIVMLTSSISDTKRSTTKWHEGTDIVQTYIETRLRHIRGSRSRHEYYLRHVSPERRCPLNTPFLFGNFDRSHRQLLTFSFLSFSSPSSLFFESEDWDFLSMYWRIDDRSYVNLVSIICSTSTWLFCLSFSTDRFRPYDNSLWQKRRVIRASTRVMNRSMDWHIFVTILLLYLICFFPKK